MTTEIPYPLNDGHHLRTYNILKLLSLENEIFFVSYSKTKDELANIDPIRELCARVHLVELAESIGSLRFFISLLLNLFSGQPFVAKRYFKKEFYRTIIQILESSRIDLAYFDMLHLGLYFEHIRGIPKVLVNHNVESLRLLRLVQVERNLSRKIYLYLQYLKLRRFEQLMCPRFDKCITVSYEDKEILTKLCGNGNFETVPNGVDSEYFKSPLDHAAREGLIWVGGMNDPFNRDAVHYFLDEILPHLKSQMRRVKITFVGNSPSKKLLKYARENPNFEITGYLKDVRPYMNRAAVFIAPIRCGGGTKLKILNAMSQSLPVVTTPIGAEGIEAVDGKDVLIASNAKEFAEKIQYLLDHPKEAGIIGKSAREVILEKYDWNVIAKKMTEVLRGLEKLHTQRGKGF